MDGAIFEKSVNVMAGLPLRWEQRIDFTYLQYKPSVYQLNKWRNKKKNNNLNYFNYKKRKKMWWDGGFIFF